MIITEVRSESFRLGWCCLHSTIVWYVAPPGECYYNTLYMLQCVFIIECGIVHFLCTVHVFSRLPLCQILFFLQPPLLS